MAIELLLQKLQYLFYTNADDGKESSFTNVKEAFFADVPDVLNHLIQNRDARELLRNCQALLEEDRDLRFTVNYLLRDKVYSHEAPYNELIHKVAGFDNQ
jgi:hypothetical protein